MLESCRRAEELGLRAIAFTDHADFTEYVRSKDGLLDVRGYLECIERCRAAFPHLQILSGVELGEPHIFLSETAAILSAGGLDRVLGSVHCISLPEGLTDASTPGLFSAERAHSLLRAYFEETLRLIESSATFEVLAHLDYPKRYWPHDLVPYREEDHEEEIRMVLTAAARRETVLEVNTTRGIDPARGLCPGLTTLRWWHEVGGQKVSLGSDAHDPTRIAEGFAHAREVIGSVGFREPADPTGFWTR